MNEAIVTPAVQKQTYYVIRRDVENRYKGPAYGWVALPSARKFATLRDAARAFAEIEQANGGLCFPIDIVRVEETQVPGVEEIIEVPLGDPRTTGYAIKSAFGWYMGDAQKLCVPTTLHGALIYPTQNEALSTLVWRTQTRQYVPASPELIAVESISTEPTITRTETVVA